jgi:DeoR/GlpR family transcriptional regulator of sugar metabolism
MQNDRQKEIIKILIEERQVKIEELARLFNVSSETIRRDLMELEKKEILRRIHGGAVYENTRAKESQYNLRAQKHQKEKHAIAKLAASYIKDGDTIAMNTGSSTLELARVIKEKQNLTIITNSFDIAWELVQNDTNNVFLLGGRLRKEGLGVSGSFTNDFLLSFRVDMVFLSIGGISVESGITDFHVEEAVVQRNMIKASNKRYVVSDYSKFKITALNKICDVSDLDGIFTDWNTPIKEKIACQERGVYVFAAKP